MITLPDGNAATDELLAVLDRCWHVGFAHLGQVHHQSLNTLRAIFAGTSLAEALTTAIESIAQGIYQPEHFRTLAAARAALQGAQYAHLMAAIRAHLNRQTPTAAPDTLPDIAPALPLMSGAAHWLMDMAIQGFARLDPADVTAFEGTLAQLRADPVLLPLAVMLNGLIEELVGAVPVTDADDAPLFRWLDVWCRALLLTATVPHAAPAQPVSGDLALMGVEMRSQQRLISVVFYGILINDNGAQWVRTTFSAYKVNAIQGAEAWLLLPQTQPLLSALRAGEILRLDAMELLPTGDLLWEAERATPGPAYKLMDVALRYLAPETTEPLAVPLMSPEKRHPIHIAEPIALANYQLEGEWVVTDTGRLRMDTARVAGTELSLDALAAYNHMVGLLRYDDQQVRVQPLAVGAKKKHIFVGSEDALKVLAKPPKKNTVAILQERASRLLREK